jgi:predicted DNA-binding transcriptional regulator YafY
MLPTPPNIMRSDEPPECDDPDARHTVHVRFAHSQGRRLRSATEGTEYGSLWHERPILMQRADGSYDLIGTTAHLDRLARWVLSHGTAATVAAPDVLRRQVAAEARRVWRRHQHDHA